MALDACVYCDCFEKGRIRISPPQPNLTVVDENGSLSLAVGASEPDWDALNAWCKEACEHSPRGHLVSHRLGNIARIALLRDQFQRNGEQFPVLLEKVIYDGVHCGDFLTLADVQQVAIELERLKEISAPNKRDEAIIREFEAQMRELVTASLSVRKPIAF